MPDTSPFGPGVLPALQTLLRFIQPHTKILIFICLVINPYNALQGWDKFPTSHPTLFVLAVLAVYGGFLKIPGIDVTGTSQPPSALVSTTGTTPAQAVSVTEPLLAIETLYKTLEPYFKAGFLLWLTCYIHHQSPLFSQSWPIYLLPFFILIVGYFSPTTRFYGPIRFGYLEHSHHFAQAYKIFLDGWVVTLIVLPFPGLTFALLVGIAGLSAAAWVRLSFAYRKELRDISSQLAKHTVRAKAAAAAAQQEASGFQHYEDQMIQAAAAGLPPRRQEASARHGVLTHKWRDVCQLRDPH
ncbi:hypothetical protein NQ176_g2987 [Zarea fungicola]|uniref:Uncharacterized protein n=1 Tax=Zarea fungicola TaxID=93591 RepID=A0ACC1NLZ0_9HYPO|nr:hypothetical protein NQ176_g2987 [Lecanicillium fungicola]